MKERQRPILGLIVLFFKPYHCFLSTRIITTFVIFAVLKSDFFLQKKKKNSYFSLTPNNNIHIIMSLMYELYIWYSKINEANASFKIFKI
jgi:hypothetical protein